MTALRSSEEGQSCPSGADARAHFVGLNVRAEARTLHVADLFRGSLILQEFAVRRYRAEGRLAHFLFVKEVMGAYCVSQNEQWTRRKFFIEQIRDSGAT
jgi:hypothetical protein